YLSSRNEKINFMIGDDIRFNENWSILVGLNRAETQTDSYDMSGTRTGGYDANEVTPSVSLIFKPFEDLTTYATYMEALENGKADDEEIGLIVTPAAVHDPDCFPLVANLGLHLVVRLRPQPEDSKRRPRYAVVPLGGPLERFVPLPSATGRLYVLLEDVVRTFAERLFPGERIAEAVVFRVTRNAGMSVDEDGAFDLLAEMEGVLDARTLSDCIRLEVEAAATKTTIQFLMHALGVHGEEIYATAAPVGLGDFMTLAGIETDESLRYPGMPPQVPSSVDLSQSLFPQIAKHDILLCHPYESFEPVVRFVQEAASDPDVLAIKQVLYRTSSKSPIIEALREAASQGKYVTALVEVKARFDEARNIEWARRLEMDGV
ncbi:MAG: TonB-dependent receptor, partial [Clostridia bacterium]|nr:TonB-dependent receptor [Clostridia bacterium]